jgi:integrase
MSNVRFYHKKSLDPNKAVLIHLIFVYQKKRFKYSTGQKIKPKYWNPTQQRAKNNRQFPEASELNTLLENLASVTLTTYRLFLNNNKIPTFDDFRKALNEITFREDDTIEETETLPTFIEFFEQFIEERASSPKYALATIKVYRTTFNHLVDYKQRKFKALDFDNIDLDFFQKYTTYLFNKKQFSTNHVNKIITTLKTVLNEATERDVNANMKYKSKKFRIPKEDAKNIYLTIEELKQLNELDLSKNSRLERVRDLFLVGCFTGLRFSDFTSIRPEHLQEVDGIRIIDIFTQKTKQPVTIPIHPIVEAIFKKYNDGENVLPRTLSNQKMNKYLKELGEVAEFNEEIVDTKSVGGVRVEEKRLKYEMISTHTARRSFATNAFKSGIASTSIMKITGHKTESSFMKYIKINNEENAVLMAQNAFFQ